MPLVPRRAQSSSLADNEIPLGRRSALYRAFEVLPALISWSAILLVFVLPLFSPRLAAGYVLAVVGIMFYRAIRGSVDLSRGYRRYKAASRVDWSARLMDIGLTLDGRRVPPAPAHSFRVHRHRELLAEIQADPRSYPHPSELMHAVIVAAYNEPYDVIAPTIRGLSYTSTPGEQLLIFLAYEERGGEEMERTAQRLKETFGSRFAAFELVKHPQDLPEELAGKGANITYAGHRLAEYAAAHGLDPENVLVTTLDCDNKPYESYFDCVAYEFIACRDRKRRSYQPISLYLSNIWDAPAITRVIASANCFWNLTCTVRPFALRNFASHTQPLDALIEIGFWSKRTIVEDGHQFWRSYFHFRGDYRVVPIHVPIFQDAVLAGGLRETMIAQFKQLSRWSYGASDVPFVAAGVFGRNRRSPLLKGTVHFLSLLEGHVTLAAVSLIIAVGGWTPFLIMHQLGGTDALVRQMPFLVGAIQQVAMISLLISLVIFWNLLPPRPVHYTRRRTVMMFAQWLLYPVTILGFNATTALYSQSRLLLGRYREKFEVTAKAPANEVREAAERTAAAAASSADIVGTLQMPRTLTVEAIVAPGDGSHLTRAATGAQRQPEQEIARRRPTPD
ncbi:hypothetical protein GCM10022261_23740 [Brevibacterium daeguense]|uniref:Glycosyltransferase, catalytic subunit of cellulose synthase and poly-beta-1,6-N-acetylglucosamine synthase n=1 Tax=Brevibacterium daeguense TaxID=909936 RepID=A0ABP8ELN2_9MICO|nr:hypothetical protein [Brevibacterium daeguense]